MSFRLTNADYSERHLQSLTRPYRCVSSPGLRRGSNVPPAGLDRYEAAIEAAERQHALLLTETFRVELLAIMRASIDPAQTLGLGFTLYRQALLHGDTSLCVEVLEKATRGMLAENDAEVTA